MGGQHPWAPGRGPHHTNTHDRRTPLLQLLALPPPQPLHPRHVTPALLFTLNSRVCRVTIAQQLVTEPAVLVLDEPTSGLDSYTALHLMRTLKQVASSGGRIVLLSFHQPSPAMFSLLDRAYLVAQVGAASWLAGQRGAAEGQAVRAARAAG